MDRRQVLQQVLINCGDHSNQQPQTEQPNNNDVASQQSNNNNTSQQQPPPQNQAPPKVEPTITSPTSMTNQSAAMPTVTTARENSKPLLTCSPDEETEDGRVRNQEAATKIRDAWIYKQIRARQDEFTQYKEARLFIGSWNVNAKGKDENLESWICKDWDTGAPPDIVAVGFQEIVDLNASNLVVDNKTQQRSQYWIDKIRTTINAKKFSNNDPMRSYTLLAYKHLVGLMICVFVKSVHYHRVKYLHTDSVGVGVLGMGGNKGGVSVRLQFYDSTLCFVCTHLAAHRENIAGRNADYENILTKVSFDVGEEAVREVIQSGSLRQWASGNSSVTIPDHDLVFWFGDLNYRIDESISLEQVMEWSNNGNFKDLRINDQLNLERAAGRVFQGFEEEELTFKPTYKYQPGTDHYDVRPDKKIRAPAWCDRVLWMAQDSEHIKPISYERSEINISDHMPVMGTYMTTIKDVIQSKRKEVYEEVMKLLDKYENQTLPMVGLSAIQLDFGEMRYEQTMTLPIKIHNTGKVVAQFRLVPKLDEVALCKSWINVNPTYGMLIPGEDEASINITITIDNDTAHALNTGREVLEDILILRLENGRDYYITIRAKYARSCFGMSVDELVMYAEPIRNIPLDPIQRAEYTDNHMNGGGNSATAAALCVPKELWRIVDAIYQKGLHEKDLFSTAGIAEEVAEIRESLDTGSAFGDFQVHSMTEVMMSFLANLSAPIVPTKVLPQFYIDGQSIQSASRRFLEDLPPIHYNVFVYVISFFREALMYKDSNGLSAGKLARICCNCLILGSQGVTDRGGEVSADFNQMKTNMQLIMIHFLETSSI